MLLKMHSVNATVYFVPICVRVSGYGLGCSGPGQVGRQVLADRPDICNAGLATASGAEALNPKP